MKTDNARTSSKENDKERPWCAIYRGKNGKADPTTVKMHTGKLDNLEKTPLHSLTASPRSQKTALKNEHTGRCDLLYP